MASTNPPLDPYTAKAEDNKTSLQEKINCKFQILMKTVHFNSKIKVSGRSSNQPKQPCLRPAPQMVNYIRGR
jgi:hypothetical protein